MEHQKDKKIAALHKTASILGTVIFSYSVISAIIFQNNRFYSSFAFGSFLLLSFVNYRLNGESAIKFFLFESRRQIAIIFIAVSTTSFFVVDYYYGVQLSGMWNWIGYGFTDYVFMFAFMNLAFILSMYELYRIIFHILAKHIPDKSFTNFKASRKISNMILIAGTAFIFSPLYVLIFHNDNFVEFAMIFPFFGVLFLTDYVSLGLKGDSVLEKIFSLNMLYIVSFILTSLTASSVTEAVNLFGHEWEYLKMPFMEFRIFTVPAAVFIGWISLVLAVVSIVNIVKNLDINAKKSATIPARIDIML